MALTQLKTAAIADDAVTTDKLANAINTARDANTAKTTNATHTGDVTGSGSLTIADNAVTLAKMAGGTDGQIITYDASGDPVAVGPGTDGQVLTSTGAGSPPAFETPAPGVGGATGVDFNDSVKVRLGTGNDLEIYHDGSDSYIANTTGSLYILPKSGENGIQLVPDGTVRLYYNNTSVFQTSEYGGNFAKAGEAIVEIGSTDGNGAYLTLDGASNGDGSGGDHATIFHDSSGNLHIKTDSPASNVSIAFSTNGTQRTIIDESGHLKPNSNNTYDLGTSSTRWRNIYTNDLNLSNEGSSNDVDGTWGSYTIQEGVEDLFLVNKRNGKKYKFNLTEVA